MSKKNKKQQQQQKKLQQEIKKQAQQAQQHKKKVAPLVKFLKANGLEFRHAVVRNTRIQYFRVDEYEQLIKQKQKQIQKNQSVSDILKSSKDLFFNFKRPDEAKRVKYPSILQQCHEKDKFASFRFDTTTSYKWKVILYLLLALSIVLFQVWPYILKYAVWLISLYLLILLVGLIVLRLVIYIVCSCFGISMWIFPNLFSEYGVIDSFKPIYIIHKWQISWLNRFYRLFALSIICLAIYYFYLDPNYFLGFFQSTKETVDVIHDWGVSLIKKQGKNFSQRAITNLQTILNQTADVISNQTYNGQSL